MVRHQTHPAVETDVFGNKEDWGENYYGQQVMKMAEEWEQRDHKESGGLGKISKPGDVDRQHRAPSRTLWSNAQLNSPPSLRIWKRWEYPFVPTATSSSNLSGIKFMWTFENSTGTTSLRNGYPGRKVSTWPWKIGTLWWKPPQKSTRVFKGFIGPYKRKTNDWRIGCLAQNIVYVVGRLESNDKIEEKI